MTSIVASDEPRTPGQTPSAQEIQRKLSVAQRKGKSRAAVAQNSGTDTEDEIQMLNPNDPTSGTGGGSGGGGLIAGASAGTSSLPGSQPLSAIAERTMSGAEESDEEEEDVEGGWQTAKSIGNRPPGVVPGGFGGANADNKLVVLHSGYLWKKGSGRRKTWKKRWFVLRPTHLACYKTSAEYKLLRLLDVADIHAATPVQLKRHPNTCGIVTRARTFYFQAETSAEMDAWVSKLNATKEALQNAAPGNGNVAGASSKGHAHNVPGTPVVIPPSSPTPTTTTTTAIASTSPGSGNSLANLVMAVKSPPSISIVVPSTSPSSGGGPNDPSSPLSAIPSTSKAGVSGGGGGGGGNTSSDSDEPGSSQQQAGGRASTSNRASATTGSSKEKDRDPGKMVLSGYLMKCGSHRKAWRKRWFVLTTTRMVYMGSHMDVKPHKQIMLNQILDAMEWRSTSHGNRHVSPGRVPQDITTEGKPGAVPSGTAAATVGGIVSGEQTASSHHQQTSASSGQAGPSDPTTNPNTMNPPSGGGATNYTFKVITPKKTLLLSAPSEEEEVRWISAIRALIARRTKETEAKEQQQHGKEKEGERTTNTSTGGGASGSGAGVATSVSGGDGRKRSSSKHLETQPTASATSSATPKAANTTAVMS